MLNFWPFQKQKSSAKNGSATALPTPTPIKQYAIQYLDATLVVLSRENIPLAAPANGQPARGARFLQIPVNLDRRRVGPLAMRKVLSAGTLSAIQAAAGVEVVNAWQTRSAIIYQYQLDSPLWEYYKRTDLPSPTGIGLGVGHRPVEFQLVPCPTQLIAKGGIMISPKRMIRPGVLKLAIPKFGLRTFIVAAGSLWLVSLALGYLGQVATYLAAPVWAVAGLSYIVGAVLALLVVYRLWGLAVQFGLFLWSLITETETVAVELESGDGAPVEEAPEILQTVNNLGQILDQIETDSRQARSLLVDAETYTGVLVELVQSIASRSEAMLAEIGRLNTALSAIKTGDAVQIATAAGALQDDHIRSLMMTEVKHADYWDSVARLSGGDALSMSRAAEELIELIKNQTGIEIELPRANELIKNVVNGQKAEIYVSGRLVEVTQMAKSVIQSLGADVDNYFSRHLGKSSERVTYRVLLTGGGVLALSGRLLRRFPDATVMFEPVLANARGLAKLAVRPGFLM